VNTTTRAKIERTGWEAHNFTAEKTETFRVMGIEMEGEIALSYQQGLSSTSYTSKYVAKSLPEELQARICTRVLTASASQLFGFG
jgi:hypothetical protein